MITYFFNKYCKRKTILDIKPLKRLYYLLELVLFGILLKHHFHIFLSIFHFLVNLIADVGGKHFVYPFVLQNLKNWGSKARIWICHYIYEWFNFWRKDLPFWFNSTLNWTFWFIWHRIIRFGGRLRTVYVLWWRKFSCQK